MSVPLWCIEVNDNRTWYFTGLSYSSPCGYYIICVLQRRRLRHRKVEYVTGGPQQLRREARL